MNMLKLKDEKLMQRNLLHVYTLTIEKERKNTTNTNFQKILKNYIYYHIKKNKITRNK